MISKQLALTMKVLLIPFLFLPLQASANGILDFTIPVNSGTLSYAGGSSALIGSNIGVSTVLGYGGTQNSFTSVNITNGQLDFATGNSTGAWQWAAGGSLAVTASGTIGNFTGTLLEGTFNDVSLDPVGLGQFDLALGGFTGTVSSQISNYYGFSDSSVDGDLGMLTYISGSPGSAFGNAPVLGGAVQAVDAAEGGGSLLTISIFLAAGLCCALGMRLKLIKLAV